MTKSVKGYWDKPFFGRVLHYFPKGYHYSTDLPICEVELKSVFTGRDQEIYQESKCKKCLRLKID